MNGGEGEFPKTMERVPTEALQPDVAQTDIAPVDSSPGLEECPSEYVYDGWRELASDHFHLVGQVVKSAVGMGTVRSRSKDDAIGWATDRLVTEARRFDPAKVKVSDINIEQYLWRRLRWGIIDGLRIELGRRPTDSDLKERDNSKRKLGIAYGTATSLDEPFGDDYGRIPRELVDPRPNPEEYAIGEDVTRRVCEAIGRLPDRQQKVARLLLEQELSQEAIADILGVTASRVSQIKAEAFRKIREELISQDGS